MLAPLPHNEVARLAALQRYRALDVLPDASFNQLTQLAAQICATPLAAVTLIDADRQWFKARVGLSAEQTPRYVAFCAHTILQTEVMLVPDAQADARFADNPLVTGDLQLRFYAGAPLLTDDGHALGALCVMDRQPRQLTVAQTAALQALSQQVISQLELNRSQIELAETLAQQAAAYKALRVSEEFKHQLIETSQDCIKVLDLEGRLLQMNAGGMRVLEICDFATVRGTYWPAFWHDLEQSAVLKAIAAAKANGVGRFLGFCPTMTGKPMWWDVIVSPLHDEAGNICQLLAVSREVTERVSAERRLRAIVEGTAHATGRDFFRSMVRHLTAALSVKIAFVTECANVEKTRARVLAFWDGKGLADAGEYDVKDTTCERVYADETCFYARELPKLFPKEKALLDLQGQSYIGLPIHDGTGALIGHLAVIDDAPMDEARGMDVLKIFAARAGAELERMKADAELRAALAEVERLKNQLLAENVYLQEEILRDKHFEEMIGSSPALLAVLQQLKRAAPTDATILILGETGTGKELLARAIHNLSARNARPLVKVNCGAISAGLVESELFGHVKGAFTGALDKRLGRFELADGGTLLLDEVGELPLETQVKLLRVLQEGEFEPVGSNKTVKVDVRIIAATNRDLEAEVAAGRFRADLFYRLNVLPLHNPPLRARREDIPALAALFASRFARRFDRRIEGIAPNTLERLQHYHWPGNIRELQNVIERAVVLATGPVLSIEPHLLPTAQPVTTPAAPPLMPAITRAHSLAANGASLNEVERQHILAVLAQTHWVIEGAKGAAKILNLHPNTLRSRMKKMGLQRPV